LITDFMRRRTGNPGLSDSEALDGFMALKTEDYQTIEAQLVASILPVYMNEIRESGSASAGSGQLGSERGFAAIETLFPGTQWSGDLSLFFSKIQTLDGGDINLLVPGGNINAGLAVAFTGAKKSSDLGIVAQKQGDINAVLRGEFLVNQSRVFTLDGGDITIWSSEGDIDAGRGAKSAIAAPPPIVSFDQSGNLVIEFPPVVSGSGIRTASTSSGVQPGDVFLFAPTGVVNAGEAGIGGKNVTIAATAVLGASNIQVSGVGTGVPTAPTGSIAAGLSGTGNLGANVAQVAEAAASMDDNNSAEQSAKNFSLGMLSVEVLGFGD
jgi:filamentous hemagglutinin